MDPEQLQFLDVRGDFLRRLDHQVVIVPDQDDGGAAGYRLYSDFGWLPTLDEAEAVGVLVDRDGCSIEQLRDALDVIEAFANRTMPHAIGQGHLALMQVASFCRQARQGEAIR